MGKRTRENRSVADRLKSLVESSPPETAKSNLTPEGVELMFKEGLGGEMIQCTISEYCRTWIFEVPGIYLHPDDDDYESHYPIYSSPSVQGSVVSDLADYFKKSTFSKQYAISPSLRHMANEVYEKTKHPEQKNRAPMFIVIEELDQVGPVEMQGNCALSDEVIVREDGERVTVLVGGREGEKFIIAVHTSDVAWPDLSNDQRQVKMVLAGVRAILQVSGPIRKHLCSSGLVTDDGRFVEVVDFDMSARLRVEKPMDYTTYREKVSEIRKGISSLVQVIDLPHMELLIDSMYQDDDMSDAHQRLHYLQLFQSLSETGEKCLGYTGKIRYDDVPVAGEKTLKELKDYRDEIAHWHRNRMDQKFLTDLQQTVNELVRRKFTSAPAADDSALTQTIPRRKN